MESHWRALSSHDPVDHRKTMFDRPEKEGSEAEQFYKRPPQLQRQEVMEAAQWGRRASS